MRKTLAGSNPVFSADQDWKDAMENFVRAIDKTIDGLYRQIADLKKIKQDYLDKEPDAQAD